ncbi:MAG: ABC transporter permease [Anaerolineales bacterium]|nr:ABC transporter permease [Anaerolineales bacterium]
MATNPSPKPDASKVLVQELMGEGPSQLTKSRWRKIADLVLVPLLSVFTALLIGAVIIALSSEDVWVAFRDSIGAGLKASFELIVSTYAALFAGAIGDPAKIKAALESGDPMAIRRAFNPFFETLVASTPYIYGGLAVALGFRGGLFNIGVEGQLFIGAITSAFVGYSLTGLPLWIHLPLTLLAGFAGGALWGFIPGYLKARTGAHEVINTIMLNYIAFRLSDWLLTGPMKRPDSFNPVSPFIQDTAKLPRFFDSPIRFHAGFFLALIVAYLVYWFLFKTRWGFDLRSVGANLHAARYAGMSIFLWTVMAMTLSGGLGGLAGSNEVLGVNYNLAMAFSSGYGFDSIALALLGKSHPLGVVLSALLFGALRNGATRMMVVSGIPIDIISILQALILAFIAAPAIIRTIYRLKAPAEGDEGIALRGWGS